MLNNTKKDVAEELILCYVKVQISPVHHWTDNSKAVCQWCKCLFGFKNDPDSALIKQQKPNRPIKPLVNCLEAPTYKTAKHLTQYLKQNFNFKNIYSVKNNIELIDKTENSNFQGNR